MKKADEKKTGKYPILPYLIGLFITVIVLVVLSYLIELRNNQELSFTSSYISTTTNNEQAYF